MIQLRTFVRTASTEPARATMRTVAADAAGAPEALASIGGALGGSACPRYLVAHEWGLGASRCLRARSRVQGPAAHLNSGSLPDRGHLAGVRLGSCRRRTRC